MEQQEAKRASVNADWSEPNPFFTASAADVGPPSVTAESDTDSPVVPAGLSVGKRSSLELTELKAIGDAQLNSGMESAAMSVLDGHALRSDE